jgi:hypothetical protein
MTGVLDVILQERAGLPSPDYPLSTASRTRVSGCQRRSGDNTRICKGHQLAVRST